MSRKFVYQQGNKAQRSLDESFSPSQGDDDVLFHLPVTKSWLYQLILGLVLICHSSYRGVVELLRDLFDTPISIGTVHNRLEAAAMTATEINQTQNLAGVEVGLHDEIYHWCITHSLLKSIRRAFGGRLPLKALQKKRWHSLSYGASRSLSYGESRKANDSLPTDHSCRVDHNCRF